MTHERAHSLGASPLTTEDYSNIAMGAMVLFATFTVGKIGVDSILKSRKEHFEGKGQSPAAVKAKESTMDGIVKIFGIAYGCYMMSQQLPVVLGEAKKLLE